MEGGVERVEVKCFSPCSWWVKEGQRTWPQETPETASETDGAEVVVIPL